MGCYLNQIMGCQVSVYPVVWFAGSIFVYNLDRWIPDPSDQINHPNRANHQRWRRWLILLSVPTLALATFWHQQWRLAAFLVPALAISVFYSVRPPGMRTRIKDFIFLKWLVPPAVILAALTGPAWIPAGNSLVTARHWPVLGCIFAGLLINILLFDQRDRSGDRAAGVATMATALAKGWFRGLLGFLAALQILFLRLDFRPELALFVGYIVLLLPVSQMTKNPNFYHWLVDGMLLIPLLGLWVLPK